MNFIKPQSIKYVLVSILFFGLLLNQRMDHTNYPHGYIVGKSASPGIGFLQNYTAGMSRQWEERLLLLILREVLIFGWEHLDDILEDLIEAMEE